MSVHGTIILQLNAILVLPLKSLKERPERIKLFPSNYVPRTKTKHIYRNIKIFITKQGKMHNVWYKIKDYWVRKEVRK